MFSTEAQHTYKLPIHTVDFTKEYQHSFIFKDIYLYITCNQLLSSVPAQRGVKSDHSTRSSSMNFVLHQSTRKLPNISPSFPQVIPEKHEPAILHIYHNSLLASHQGVWEVFLKIFRDYYMQNILTKNTNAPKSM